MIPLLVSFAIGLPGKADNYSGWLQWANLMPGWLLYTIWYVLILLTAIWVVSVFDHWLEQRSTLIRLGDVVSSKLKGNAEEYPEGTVVTEIRQLALNGGIVLFGKKNPNEKLFHEILRKTWEHTQLDIFNFLADGPQRIDTETNNNDKWYDLHIAKGDSYKLKKRWWWM